MLSRENFIKARDYIFANSDDINRAWFHYNFEDEDTEKFMEVLAKYQHENGGCRRDRPPNRGVGGGRL